MRTHTLLILSCMNDLHPDWQRQTDPEMLVRVFQFPDFPAAIHFVQRVGELAEAADHHPDIDIRYTTVRVALCTHDTGHTVTKRDTDLARQIDHLTTT